MIRNQFQTVSPKNVQYDFYDLFAKTGYKRFNLMASTNNTTTNYFLATETLDSNPRLVNYAASGSTGGIAVRSDVDYDLLMKKAQRIGGKFIFDFTTECVGASSGQADMYVVVTIYQVAIGGAETQIGTARTPQRTAVAGNVVTREVLSIDVANTDFKVGENLRITVQLYVGATNANSYGEYYIDPTNFRTPASSGATENTDFLVTVPFSIGG
jgi:hypothetical protein